MNHRIITVALLCGIALVLACHPAWSETASRNNARFTLGMGLTLGGETLATAEYTDGTTTDIDTGDLIHLYAGMVYDFPDSPYQGSISLGYHFDTADDGDKSVSFERYPLEVLGFIRQDRYRFGAGISYHLSPEFEQSDFGQPDVKFDDALGVVFEAGFHLSKILWLDLRYVFIEYDVDKVGSQNASGSIDGDHFGLYLSMDF